MRQTRWNIIVASILWSGLSLQAVLADTQVIALGAGAPLTGPQARYGQEYKLALDLALEDFNARKPVIDGKQSQFSMTLLDDQADPKQATVAAQKLLDLGVKGIVGHFNSGTTIPASGIYSRAGIPQISLSTSPVYTRQGFKTVFRGLTSDTQQGGVMGRYVVDNLHAKRIVIIDDRTAYGQGLADEFEKGVKSAGGTIIDREFVTDKAVDFKAVLTNAKSKNPDLLYFAGVDAQSAPMLNQMRSLGMPTTFASGDMSKSQEFLKMTSTNADGAIVSLPGLPLDKMPGGKAFAARYEKKYGEAPSTYAPYAYDAATVLMDAMLVAKSSNPSDYLPVLAKTNISGVASDHIAFDGYGDLKSATITVYKASKGAWQPVATIDGK
jgi:branched-chain amino acid transport system substrate-binding protein